MRRFLTRPAQQVTNTKMVAISVSAAAARMHQTAGPQWASTLAGPLVLTACLMISKPAKSQAMAMTVATKARKEKKDATKEPRKLVPRQRRKAKKVRPAAMGCRIMTFVRILKPSRSDFEKLREVTWVKASVPS